MKKHIVKLSELCFYIFFLSLLFAKGIGLYDGQTIFKVFLIIAFIGWMGKMLLTKYLLWEIPLYGLLILLGGAVYLTSHDKGALFVILLLCSLKNMDLKKIFKVGTVTWILSFGMLFILTSLHIVDSAFKVHDRLGMGRIIRWNLGYAHPNVLHISYFVLVCFLIYLLNEKIRIYHLLLLELGNLYVFMYSLSTTGFLVTTICLVLVFYWSVRKGFCKVEQILIQLCLPLCLFLSFGAPLLFKGRLFDILNKLLNTRLELSKWFLQNQQIKLLGVDTTSIVTYLRTMDNSYVHALITYGSIFFVLVILGYFRIIYKKTLQQDGIALCLILSCLIAGITEPFLFNTSFKNISILFIGVELFKTDGVMEERTVGLKFDRNIGVSLPSVASICNNIWTYTCKYGVRLAIVSTIGAVQVGAVVYMCDVAPERYLLPRKAFEYTDDIEECYHLASENDIQQEGDRIMGYETEQTEMVPFKGNIAQVEQFRNTVTGGIVSGFLFFVIGKLILFVLVRNKDGVRRNEE